MQRVLMVGVLSMVSAGLLVGCGEDDACASETETALSRVPESMTGSVNLNYEGQTLPIGVNAKALRVGCGFDFELRQQTNDLCGDRFQGPLSFMGDNRWSGTLSSTNPSKPTSVNIQLTTLSASQVEIKAEIVESSEALCEGQHLQGVLRP